jgi:hypothetical protein
MPVPTVTPTTKETELGKCNNCGTAQGPFVSVKGFPGLRACGLRGKGIEPAAREKRVKECLGRRDKIDGGRQ